MIAARLVAAAVLAQVTTVVVLVAGLAALASGVEQAHLGAGPALRLALLRTPGVVVMVLPALVAAGAGLAAARLAARGARVSLEAAGAAPARTGRGAAAVGLVVGLLGFAAHGWAVPAAERAADALAPSAQVGWVWLEGGAWRSSDGVLVVAEGRHIRSVGSATVDPDEVERRREEQAPWRARWGVLAASADRGPAVERWGRLGRVAGCALLALCGWLPLARRPRVQAGAAALVGVGWLAVDAVARSAAAQGALAPAAGGGLAAAVLALALLGAALRGAYFTRSQAPV